MEIYHDCWSEILKHIDDCATYKSAIWTCKRFWKYFEPTHTENVRKYSNHLLTLIKIFPNKKWNWHGISFNPNITWDIIVNNPQYDWDWYWISQNPNITWDIIVNNPKCKWSWFCISQNPNITWDIIVNNPQYDWDFFALSYNKFNKK